MLPPGLRSHTNARLLAGRPTSILGRLLTDVGAGGVRFAIDPATGGELSTKDPRPAFVLSTEGEATDGNVLRQFWDLSRMEAGICPILWNHDKNRFLGQWQDGNVAARDAGPSLVARAFFDEVSPPVADIARQVRSGLIPGCSVRWINGLTVRRSELDKADPLYREPAEDMCGMPDEGYVIGSPEQRNVLVECSIVTMPADPAALNYERALNEGARDIEQLARGGVLRDEDIGRALLTLADHPRIGAYLARREAAFRTQLLAEVRALLAPATNLPSAGPRRLSDLFPTRVT